MISIREADQFGGETQTVSEAVVEAVAEHECVSETQLPPLQTAIDPDALTSLFQSGSGFDEGDPVHVSFVYHGYKVRLYGRGDAVLLDLSEDASE